MKYALSSGVSDQNAAPNSSAIRVLQHHYWPELNQHVLRIIVQSLVRKEMFSPADWPREMFVVLRHAGSTWSLHDLRTLGARSACIGVLRHKIAADDSDIDIYKVWPLRPRHSHKDLAAARQQGFFIILDARTDRLPPADFDAMRLEDDELGAWRAWLSKSLLHVEEQVKARLVAEYEAERARWAKSA